MRASAVRRIKATAIPNGTVRTHVEKQFMPRAPRRKSTMFRRAAGFQGACARAAAHSIRIEANARRKAGHALRPDAREKVFGNRRAELDRTMATIVRTTGRAETMRRNPGASNLTPMARTPRRMVCAAGMARV